MSTSQQTSLSLSEPWRYECPTDGCDRRLSSLNRRVSSIGGNRGGPNTRTKHGEMNDPHARYYCEGCGTPLRELLDKKTDELIYVGTRNEQ